MSEKGSYKIRVRVDESKLFQGVTNKLQSILQNDEFKLRKHELLADMCNEYVPEKTGELAYNVEITTTAVRYLQPYARYQYFGLVYGPNYGPYADKETGELRWRSPPGEGTKYPTGEHLQYNTEFHPLATDHWQRAMMRDKRDEFLTELRDLILEYK